MKNLEKEKLVKDLLKRLKDLTGEDYYSLTNINDALLQRQIDRCRYELDNEYKNGLK